MARADRVIAIKVSK